MTATEALASFVGREPESARLAELLREVPLVTVTGPGGVGKTRLAAHVARQVSAELEDGARWCDLGGVDPAGSVALAVATALGARNVAQEQAEAALPDLLAGRQLLVVLDNCEHVAESAAALAARIASAPEAHVLATSRESLGVPGEHVVVLEPLGVPSDDSLEAVRASEAARLFCARAAAVRSGFELDEDNAPDIARLCRRLDGLPLAVELAAARARSLSPRELADRLEERFALLTRRKGHAAYRHESLRAAVDWSFELLSEPERALFARMGVFVSGAGLSEVEAICSGDPIARPQVVDLLDQLIDRSLVTSEHVRGSTRYGMLETLRAYARERLDEREGLEALRERHADHHATAAARARLEELSDWDASGFMRRAEADELLAALRWCVKSDPGSKRSFRLLAPLWALVHTHAAAEVTDLAERALARWSARTEPLAVEVLGVAAVGHHVLGQPERARARALEAISIESDTAPALMARRALALVTYHFGSDLEQADPLLGEAIVVAERSGARWVALELTALRALVLAGRGDSAGAARLAAGARASARAAGARHLLAWTTYVLGTIELAWGSTGEARAEFERSLALARDVDFRLLVGGSLRQLGVVAALEADRARAAELLTGALHEFRSMGDRVAIWEALRSVAIALAAVGEEGPALRLLHGADAADAARVLAPPERALLERVLPHRDAAPVEAESLEQLMQLASEELAARRPAGAAEQARPRTKSPDSGRESPDSWRESPRAMARSPNVFRRDGSLWTLEFAGTVVLMPHLKGLSDLATLLANPGHEIHCLDLIAGRSPTSHPSLPEAADGLQGDLGEVIDAEARARYRARLRELEAEIEDARRAHDPVRTERAQDELAAIADQLQAAYGLGGRPRRAGDPAERARAAVTWRIRSALRKLEREHAQLARHLRNAVRTGTWCVYDPETPVPWKL